MTKFYDIRSIDTEKTYHFIIAERNHGRNHNNKGGEYDNSSTYRPKHSY